MAELWQRLGRLLVGWTVISTLSGALAFGLFLYLDVLLPGGSPGEIVIRLAVAGLAAGGVLGWAQARMGSAFGRSSNGWTAATAASWSLAIPAVVGFSTWIRPLVADLPDGFRLGFSLIGVGAIGALASAWQFSLLRSTLEGALWWPLANAVGWLMAWILVLAVGLFLGGGEPLPVDLSRFWHGLVLGACAGFVIGLEQGVALVGLIAQEAWNQR